MPYKKRYRSRRRKKKSYRRSYRRRAPRYPNILLGDHQYIRHKLFTPIVLDPGSNLAALAVFSGNSLFDPTQAQGNIQVRGFDQITTLFSSYLVLKSRLKATFVNSSETALDQYICFVCLMNSDTTTTAVREYAEQRNVTLKSIGPQRGQVVISKSMYPAKQLGFPNGGRAEEDLKGTGVNDPVLQSFYQVGATSAESTDPSPISVIVEMEFWALWTHPVNPTNS